MCTPSRFAPSADPTDDPAKQSLFLTDAGTASGGGQVAEMSLAPLAALALTPEPTVRVQTIATSSWVPAAPDTSGIAYETANDRLVVSDSEVEEVTGAGYHGANLWKATRAGTVTDTGTTFPAFSSEPTGLAFRDTDNTLLVSDDNANAVTFVQGGADGRHGTADDVRTTMSTMPFSDDSEDVAYDPASGDVYIVDGVSKEVFHVNPGPNGTFGDADDAWSQFDVEQYGASDPEGIGYRPITGTLLVADQSSHALYELTTAGALLHIFDLRSAPMVQVADVVVAPGSMRPERANVWLVDRGVDNDIDSTENDGRIHELSIDSSGNTAPVVDTVRIDQTTPRTNDVLTVDDHGPRRRQQPARLPVHVAQERCADPRPNQSHVGSVGPGQRRQGRRHLPPGRGIRRRRRERGADLGTANHRQLGARVQPESR